MSSIATELYPASLEDELAQLEPAKPKDWLGEWRTGRLGAMKQRPEYQGLPLLVRNLVDYMVKRHEHPVEGIIVGQAKLAARFGVCRETINRWLGLAVRAGVFTVEPRRRGLGTKGGRTTNRYRLNDALFQGLPTADVTQPVTQPPTQPPTAEATQREGPTGQREAPQVEAPTGQNEEQTAAKVEGPALALVGQPVSEGQVGSNRGDPPKTYSEQTIAATTNEWAEGVLAKIEARKARQLEEPRW